MKRLGFVFFIALALAAILSFALCGCAIAPEEAVPEPPQEEIENPIAEEPEPSENEIEATDEMPYSFPENLEVFDFDVLPEDEFPRGSWTVNQLINTYGIPEVISAHYSLNYMGAIEVVFTNVLFKGFGVYFNGEQAERFSFYNESIVDGTYTLDERDRDLELEILYLWFIDENTSLPCGIKIRETTKSQVLEAYPVDSAHIYQSAGMYDSGEKYYIDMLTYYYAFRNENGNLPEWVQPPWNPGFEIGNIDYLFNANEILMSVKVQWEFFDI